MPLACLAGRVLEPQQGFRVSREECTSTRVKCIPENVTKEVCTLGSPGLPLALGLSGALIFAENQTVSRKAVENGGVERVTALCSAGLESG